MTELRAVARGPEEITTLNSDAGDGLSLVHAGGRNVILFRGADPSSRAEGDPSAAFRKISPTEGVLWTRTLPVGWYDSDRAPLVVDGNGTMYLAGHFAGTAVLGDTTLQSVVNPGVPLTANDGRGAPSRDAYVARLNEGGDVEWVRQLGGTSTQQSAHLRFTETGRLLLQLDYSGQGEIDGQPIVSSGGSTVADEVHVQLSLDGDIESVLQLNELRGIGAIDEEGNRFYAETRCCPPASDADAGVPTGPWLMKLDSSGGREWLRYLPYDDPSRIDLVVEADGTSIVAAHASTAGKPPIGLAKVSPDGDLVFSHEWGQRAAYDYVSGVAVLDDRSMVVGGWFSEELDVGGGPLSKFGFRTLFLARLSEEGQHVWSFSLGHADWSVWVTDILRVSDGVVAVSAYAQTSSGVSPHRSRAFVFWMLP